MSGGKSKIYLGQLSDEVINLIHSQVPVGTFMWHTGTKAPATFMVPDGNLYDRTTNKPMWDFIQTCGLLISDEAWLALDATQNSVPYFSTGDGASTFRMMAIRDYISAPHDGKVVGDWVGDAIRNIEGRIGIEAVDVSTTGAFKDQLGATSKLKGTLVDNDAWSTTFDASRVVPTANENRPKTSFLLPVIKAFGGVGEKHLLMGSDVLDVVNNLRSGIEEYPWLGIDSSYSFDGTLGLTCEEKNRLTNTAVVETSSGRPEVSEQQVIINKSPTGRVGTYFIDDVVNLISAPDEVLTLRGNLTEITTDETVYNLPEHAQLDKTIPIYEFEPESEQDAYVGYRYATTTANELSGKLMYGGVWVRSKTAASVECRLYLYHGEQLTGLPFTATPQWQFFKLKLTLGDHPTGHLSFRVDQEDGVTQNIQGATQSSSEIIQVYGATLSTNSSDCITIKDNYFGLRPAITPPLFNPCGGSVYCELHIASNPKIATRRIFNLNKYGELDHSLNCYILFSEDAYRLAVVVHDHTVSNHPNIGFINIPINSDIDVKIAVTYSNKELCLCVNGGVLHTVNITTDVFFNFKKLYIGNGDSLSHNLDAHIYRFDAIDRVLSHTEMQAITK